MAFLTIVKFYNRKLNNKRMENHIPLRENAKKKKKQTGGCCMYRNSIKYLTLQSWY